MVSWREEAQMATDGYVKRERAFVFGLPGLLFCLRSVLSLTKLLWQGKICLAFLSFVLPL